MLSRQNNNKKQTEMIYPFMFDVYPELMPLKAAANILAEWDDWEELYDTQQLGANQVPIYAVSYMDDMYVDWDLAQDAVRHIPNVHVFHTNSLLHNAVRAKPDEVLSHLFRLRDDTMD